MSSVKTDGGRKCSLETVLWLNLIVMEDRWRIFVALALEPDFIKAILDRIEPLIPPSVLSQLRLVPVSNSHITLKFLGSVDVGEVAELRSQLRNEGFGKIGRFELNFSDLEQFPRRGKARGLWMGCRATPPGLVALKSRIDELLSRFAQDQTQRAFTPHLTVARVRGNALLKLSAELLQEINAVLQEQSYRVRFDSFGLYRSVLAPDGAQYELLDSYQLGD